MSQLLAAACAALSAAGAVQAGMGWRAVSRFCRQAREAPAERPAVTVLKPLHGDEPLLEQALASLCAQDYPRFQIVFGLQDPADPALHILRRLHERFPGVDMAVVVDPTPHGINRKVANLINMYPAARHDVLVIADSDVHTAPDYLDQLVASLHTPGTGLVTTLYAALPASATLAGVLGATGINHGFLPGALMARDLGRRDCLGATMCLRRGTLERIGGLRALSDHLADDAVLGHLVHRLGLGVALAATVPATTIPETSMPALFHHELRWARTIRSVAPVGFVLGALQHPLGWAALALALSEGALWAWLAFALVWAARAVAAAGIDRALRLTPGAPIWWLALRDLLSLAIMLASYGSNRVAWRGQQLHAIRPRLTQIRVDPPRIGPARGITLS